MQKDIHFHLPQILLWKNLFFFFFNAEFRISYQKFLIFLSPRWAGGWEGHMSVFRQVRSSYYLGLNFGSFYFFEFAFRVILFFLIVEIYVQTSIPVKEIFLLPPWILSFMNTFFKTKK